MALCLVGARLDRSSSSSCSTRSITSVRIFAARLISRHHTVECKFSMRSRMSSISKEKRYRGAIVLGALDCRHSSFSPMIHQKTTLI